MLVSIDVGNTQTTLGLFSDDGTGDLIHAWRMSTTHADTADMLHARVVSYFDKDHIPLEELRFAALASVVPNLLRAWIRCFEQLLKIPLTVVESGNSYGMHVNMPIPTQVGADRIANALAARATYGSPVIVVDFGTATNIDVVDQHGSFRGGVISPGLILSAEALFARAAKLSSTPIIAPPYALGDTTERAIQSGLVIGAAAQTEGLVRRIIAELGLSEEEVPVIGTGGLASTVSGATDIFTAIDPSLTLRGIVEIWKYERNQ